MVPNLRKKKIAKTQKSGELEKEWKWCEKGKRTVRHKGVIRKTFGQSNDRSSGKKKEAGDDNGQSEQVGGKKKSLKPEKDQAFHGKGGEERTFQSHGGGNKEIVRTLVGSDEKRKLRTCSK